jgi:energy-converting hydrogenase Eha subunit H
MFVTLITIANKGIVTSITQENYLEVEEEFLESG